MEKETHYNPKQIYKLIEIKRTQLKEAIEESRELRIRYNKRGWINNGSK